MGREHQGRCCSISCAMSLSSERGFGDMLQ